MLKIVKKTGNSLCIILDANDIKIYNLKQGDILDIELVKVKKKR